MKKNKGLLIHRKRSPFPRKGRLYVTLRFILGPSGTPVPTINKDNTKLQGENHNQAFLKKTQGRSPDKTSFSSDNAFSFDTKGPKEKALQKEKPVVISLVATSDQGSAFGNRKLFEKSLSKNVALGIVLTQAFPSLKFFGATFLSRKVAIAS